MLHFFFQTYLFYLVCSPRLGGQKRSCWKRLRHEDRWLWLPSKYLQEWLIWEDKQWCFANEVDGDRIIVFEGVLREKWCVSTNDIVRFQKISVLPPSPHGRNRIFQRGGGVNLPNFPVGRGEVTIGKYFLRVLVTRNRVTKKKHKNLPRQFICEYIKHDES